MNDETQPEPTESKTTRTGRPKGSRSAPAPARERTHAAAPAPEAKPKTEPKTTGRRLATRVHVGDEVYEAGDTPPAEVAEKITNPRAWQ